MFEDLKCKIEHDIKSLPPPPPPNKGENDRCT